jgi:Trk-type K+ transport system membrane component
MFTLILLFIGAGVLVYSLVYTLFVAKERKAVRGDIDTEIPDKVQKHAYLRNPVFLTYAIFFGIVLALIMYFAFTWNW